jgi:hypothetical protein
MVFAKQLFLLGKVPLSGKLCGLRNIPLSGLLNLVFEGTEWAEVTGLLTLGDLPTTAKISNNETFPA